MKMPKKTSKKMPKYKKTKKKMILPHSPQNGTAIIRFIGGIGKEMKDKPREIISRTEIIF